jgi:hypothetical protein
VARGAGGGGADPAGGAGSGALFVAAWLAEGILPSRLPSDPAGWPGGIALVVVASWLRRAGRHLLRRSGSRAEPRLRFAGAVRAAVIVPGWPP